MPTDRFNFWIRSVAVFLIAPIILIGLFARSRRATASPDTMGGFLATYTGDTLWPIMFFLLGRILLPRANRWRLVGGVLLLTMTIEFAQLWQPPTLQWLRRQPVVGFLLGNSFVWSDVACIVVGSLLAVAIDFGMARITREHAQPS